MYHTADVQSGSKRSNLRTAEKGEHGSKLNTKVTSFYKILPRKYVKTCSLIFKRLALGYFKHKSVVTVFRRRENNNK